KNRTDIPARALYFFTISNLVFKNLQQDQQTAIISIVERIGQHPSIRAQSLLRSEKEILFIY
ncbi:MAG TPA: hypothetical protein VJ799_14370, partial [Nitrososphaeraceae archaeon]|nr:hypothetical protein [Nitrososphaeraceae archaeon]